MITHFDAFEIYYVFKNIMKNGAFAPGANAPFSIMFSSVQNFTKQFLIFFSMLSKIENDVMI